MSGLFRKKSKEDVFWDWFLKNSELYYRLEENQNVLFVKLKSELEKIHPDIVFEFSPVFNDGTREFIISADGIKTIFPIVINLVNRAPASKIWKFIAFRQPRKNITKIRYQNLTIELNDVFFRYSKHDGKIELELNMKNFHESREWTAASFILLDNVLGEYHTEMALGSIKRKNLNETEINTLLPIRCLPEVIQSYQSELNN